MSEREISPAQSTRPTLNYMQLRRIAEWASGYRGSRFWMVARHGATPGAVVIHKEDEDPGDPPDAVVIPCDTPVDAHRPRVIAASIQAQGDPHPVDLLNLVDRHGAHVGPADAVFWTQSAVEKFVVPYYASVGGETAGHTVTMLLNAFEGIPVASPVEEGEVYEHTPVYGMVHIPKSEYIELMETGTMADEHLGFVAHDPVTGRGVVFRLRDLLDQPGSTAPGTGDLG